MPKSKSLPHILAALALLCGLSQAQAASDKSPYPAMAPAAQYMIADQAAEVALARTAAPPSISDSAEVMVLGKAGYVTVAKGTNGFVCLVERGWGAGTTDPDFWNPKVRSPICFNPASARSVMPVYLMRTQLVLAGKSPAEMLKATDAAFDKKELPAIEPGAMCYMMSKQQYLNDRGEHWHPHLMFFVAGDDAKSWGADLPGSPVISANDPEDRATIFMVWLGKWSDGTPGPAMH